MNTFFIFDHNFDYLFGPVLSFVSYKSLVVVVKFIKGCIAS